jgi:hypothetical protein
MKETIYDAFCEGPFGWENYGERLKPNHVLYVLH